jgi:hypothetical protein
MSDNATARAVAREGIPAMHPIAHATTREDDTP